MAYTNSFMPGGTGTINQYQSPYSYSWPQQPQSQVLQQQSNSTGGLMTIFVQSEDEVSNYPVAAGLTVLLISFGLKKFWLKSTDTSGVPQQPRSFSFNEETPLQNQNGSFVSRAEFSELSSKLDKLISELGGTKNE